MAVQEFVILLAVLIGLTNAVTLQEPEKKLCVDNTLYAMFACQGKSDGERMVVPGKCGEYFECSKGSSTKKSCPKFFDPEKKICVSELNCIEVDNTDCIIPTPPPPPCYANTTTSPPSTCVCPTPAPIPTCPTPPTCPPPTACPKPPSCPEIPTIPPTCPPEKPCHPPSGGPCGNWFDPNDLYGSFVCRGKADGTMLIAIDNCKDYYYCIGGHSYLKSCGRKRYFNPKVNACDEKSSVYCPSEKNLGF